MMDVWVDEEASERRAGTRLAVAVVAGAVAALIIIAAAWAVLS